MSIVEVVEEGIKVVEVVTEGPQGPAGEGFAVIELAAGVTELTTTSSQIVICNNTNAGTVILNTSPAEGEEVIVKIRNAQVTIQGTIDGFTDLTLTIFGSARTLIYSSFTDDWSIL